MKRTADDELGEIAHALQVCLLLNYSFFRTSDTLNELSARPSGNRNWSTQKSTYHYNCWCGHLKQYVPFLSGEHPIST